MIISEFNTLQYYLPDVNQGIMFWERRMLSKIENEDIDTVIAKTQIGEKYTCTTYVLNEHKKPLEIVSEDRHVRFEYVKDSLISRVLITSKKKTEELKFHYIGDKLVLSETYVNQKLQSRTSVQYNEFGKILFSIIEYPKKRNTFSMHYEYDDSTLVQQQFMKNGKMMRVWDYSCNPQGEDILAPEALNICHYKEENKDGSYVLYSRQEEEGQVVLYKHFYNIEKELIKSESWLNDTDLQWVSETEGNTNTFIVYKDAEKNKIKSKIVTKYDEEGRTRSSKRWWKDNDSSISEARYEYDDAGKVISEASFYKGKLKHQVVYSYQ